MGCAVTRPWIRWPESASSRVQGWKLHLSSIPPEAITLLRRVLPVLKQQRVSFKVVEDIPTLMALNEGALGVFQIGKFITIYPGDDEQALRLARDLVKLTARFRGPKIITDLRLGDVLYARFGGFNPILRRDRFGHVSRWIHAADALIADEYTVPFRLPEGVRNPFARTRAFARYRPKPLAWSKTRTIGPGYKILDIVKSQAKGSTFLAIDTRKPTQHGIVIIKEGRGWCDMDRQGRDIRERLSHQRRMLETLNNKPYVPKAYDLFDFNGNRYLVLEFIRGQSLAALPLKPFGALSQRSRKQLLGVCIRLVEAVADLHAQGIVHRDLTVRNMWVRENNSVCLIDLELAHVLGSRQVPYGTGTPGFMSPQQAQDQPPTPQDDIHALGASLLHLLTRLDPRRLLYVHPRDRVESVQYLAQLADLRLATLLCDCLEEQPERRPALADLAAALRDLRSKPQQSTRPSVRSSNLIDKCDLADAYKGVLHGTMRDPTGALFVSAKPRTGGDDESCDFMHLRSANNGMAGVLYVMSRFHRQGLSGDGDGVIANRLVDWLLAHHRTEDDQLPGLHFGEAGVAVAIAEAMHSGWVEPGPWAAEYFNEALNGPVDWPDLTHGAAGQGIACLICSRLLKREDLLRNAHHCAEYLLHTQDDDGSWKLGDAVASLKGVNYTGFAHGGAGILYFLIEYHQRFGDSRIWDSVRKGVRWLKRQRIRSRTFTTWPLKPADQESWHWWCHGEAGIALTFLKLYQASGDEPYRDIAVSALSFHQSPVRFANLSQCHGLSGLGEIYLEAFKALGDDRWKSKAAEIVVVLQKLAQRDAKKGITWLVENPHRPMADLMVGNGGVAHFWLRYLHADDESLSFPLLP